MGISKTREEIIKEFKQIHGDKYDYSKVVYVNAKTKIEDFKQKLQLLNKA